MESPLRTWLALQCQRIAGAEAGLLVLGACEHAAAARVERWPSPREVTPRLSASVDLALRRGEAVAQAHDPPADASRASATLAFPISAGDAVAGAVGLSLSGIAHSDLKEISDELSRATHELSPWIQLLVTKERFSTCLALGASLLDHDRLAEAAHTLAGEVALRLRCDRVAVGLRQQANVRVLAVSNSLQLGEGSDAVRHLRLAMEEALDQDAVIELPPPASAPHCVTEDHEHLARNSGSETVCTVPLVARGAPVGALTCEWTAPDAIDPTLREKLRNCGTLAGPILALMLRAEAGLLSRARELLARWAQRSFGPERGLATAAGAACAALLLLVALVPADYRISARATLEGRVQRALVAAVPGYLAEAHARPGDVVREGDLLARLDDRDLLLERRGLESQRAQLEREYREALATGDRTRVSIVQAQIEQAAAQLALVDEQLARTRVVAPFDSIVLEGDLDRALGSPLEQGSVLFELAPLDGYRIILEIDGRDIADVAVGQRGQLALAALPGRQLPLVVERITPIVSSGEGRSYFRVEAVLEEPSPQLRPGMEGVAKIHAGRRQLLWIWSHGLLDWLRLQTWSLLP